MIRGHYVPGPCPRDAAHHTQRWETDSETGRVVKTCAVCEQFIAEVYANVKHPASGYNFLEKPIASPTKMPAEMRGPKRKR